MSARAEPRYLYVAQPASHPLWCVEVIPTQCSGLDLGLGFSIFLDITQLALSLKNSLSRSLSLSLDLSLSISLHLSL